MFHICPNKMNIACCGYKGPTTDVLLLGFSKNSWEVRLGLRWTMVEGVNVVVT